MKKIIFLILVLLVIILGIIYWIFAPLKEENTKEKESEELTKEEEIKLLFAEKYDEEISNITITIDKEKENYVKGIIIFGEGGPGQAGGFLAVNQGGAWELTYDGNGVIPCSAVDPYEFPTDMVTECFNEETQTYIDRTIE